MEVAVQCASSCLLVLTDLFDPDWVASLDGEPVDVVPVNFLFRGARVPSGSHRLAFEYRPKAFRLGTGISGVAFVVLVALMVRRRS